LTSHKTQNPILVIATLGVYFGLILAGATPQVLANAAMTRQFDVKDEVEIKDDLDTKPNGVDFDELASDDLFLSAVIDLAQDFSRLAAQKKFSWERPHHVTVEGLSFCESDNSPSYLGSGEISPTARAAFEKAAIRVGREYFKYSSSLGIGKKFDAWPFGVSFGLSTEQNGLDLSIKFVTKDVDASRVFGEEVARILSQPRPGLSVERKIVLENSKSKITDNTVILVIHLPRAGLSSLLSSQK